MTTWTVGQVADVFGVTVRTLHHYDEIGLLTPSERSRAGYRLYTDEDLTRLQQIVVYRRLEMPLEEIATLLDNGEDAVAHLRRQREAVMTRLDELTDIVVAIDRALEREMSNEPATPEDLKELFGDGFEDEYQQEAHERWGHTDAWKQSAARVKRYTKADWAEVKAEMEAVGAAFVAAKRSGEPATSEAAMDAAEQHRRHINDRFYDIDHDFHRGLADMYVADPRFTKTYDDQEPGLAAYVRDAIHANADRHAE
ncbi:MerR family transcriptional regulator [Terrabacter sp. MAHUQ-38]|uniref:MerR family transcriptional regulator n=1 Tax=unclassified Terrabacter TaxID=2630222 RepID=UPI00165DF743|nr:MerR family transcriptional regulator [Terrabacter sp. MAHUQ-38]MBC9822400.1 MerR family transcriptional regulator [Terrabacter sp. MAHUQ-38]